ncbi:MAG: hypothetical protein JWQ63_3427 [Mucilaginibacter sp.]|nr:hypothetical protein [Mucilaginibacter sp.]
MPKFSIQSFFKWLSIFADVLSIGYVLYNIKDMSIHNPAISILFYSFLATILFFLMPFLFNKMTTLAEKIMISILSLIIVISIILFWVHITNEIEVKPISTNKKPLVSSLGTTKKSVKENYTKDKPFINIPIKKSNIKSKHNLSVVQILVKKNDSSSKSKYDLRHATVSQSAVGDYAKVEINQKPSPREVTKELIKEIESRFPNKNEPTSVWRASDDPESFEFQRKLISALQAAGYTNLKLWGHQFDYDSYDVGYSESLGYHQITIPINH